MKKISKTTAAIYDKKRGSDAEGSFGFDISGAALKGVDLEHDSEEEEEINHFIPPPSVEQKPSGFKLLRGTTNFRSHKPRQNSSNQGFTLPKLEKGISVPDLDADHRQDGQAEDDFHKESRGAGINWFRRNAKKKNLKKHPLSFKSSGRASTKEQVKSEVPPRNSTSPNLGSTLKEKAVTPPRSNVSPSPQSPSTPGHMEVIKPRIPLRNNPGEAPIENPPIPQTEASATSKPLVTPQQNDMRQIAISTDGKEGTSNTKDARIVQEEKLKKAEIEFALKEYSKRVDELVRYYEIVDPDRQDKLNHCRELLRKYPPGNVALAVKKKYGSIPEGWEDYLEEAQGAILFSSGSIVQ